MSKDRKSSNRFQRSSSLPPFRRKVRYKFREKEDGGFSPLQEKNYSHDTEAIKFSSKTILKAARKLHELQPKIERKSKKETSKELDQCKEDYDEWLATLVKEVKALSEDVSEKTLHVEEEQDRSKHTTKHCDECFHRDKDILRLQAEIDSLRTQLNEERKDKRDALIRLSAMTSSRLKDNNPNLTDLSDPNRPAKIGEMFSELYDNEWTDAYDELTKSETEVEAINHLNSLVMTAYDCCMKQMYHCRLFLNSALIKIDSELRQNMIEHMKRNAMVVLQELREQIDQKIRSECCNIATSSISKVSVYIKKSIEVCWLMAIQDPPMRLYNTRPTEYDSSKYRDYQTKGPYTAYIVWPAIALHESGPLLSKGVAEGTLESSRTKKCTGRSNKQVTRNHNNEGDVSRQKQRLTATTV